MPSGEVDDTVILQRQKPAPNAATTLEAQRQRLHCPARAVMDVDDTTIMQRRRTTPDAVAMLDEVESTTIVQRTRLAQDSHSALDEDQHTTIIQRRKPVEGLAVVAEEVGHATIGQRRRQTCDVAEDFDSTTLVQRRRPTRDSRPTLDDVEQTTIIQRRKHKEDLASVAEKVGLATVGERQRQTPEVAEEVESTTIVQRQRPARDLRAAFSEVDHTTIVQRRKLAADVASAEEAGNHATVGQQHRQTAHDVMDFESTTIMHRKKAARGAAMMAEVEEVDSTTIVQRKKTAQEMQDDFQHASLEQRRWPTRDSASAQRPMQDAAAKRELVENSTIVQRQRPARDAASLAEVAEAVENTTIVQRKRPAREQVAMQELVENTTLVQRQKPTRNAAAASEGVDIMTSERRAKLAWGLAPLDEVEPLTMRREIDHTTIVQRRKPGNDVVETQRSHKSALTTSHASFNEVEVAPAMHGRGGEGDVEGQAVQEMDFAAVRAIADLDARISDQLDQMNTSFRGKVEIQHSLHRARLERIRVSKTSSVAKESLPTEDHGAESTWSSGSEGDEVSGPSSRRGRPSQPNSGSTDLADSDLLALMDSKRVPLEDLDRRLQLRDDSCQAQRSGQRLHASHNDELWRETPQSRTQRRIAAETVAEPLAEADAADYTFGVSSLWAALFGSNR
mmetsp:Transcript_66791/g.186348  ORF Transcript_66791/g.186348 Transcript_66791/m.186348 type:complete len:677 (-) Transcript_66791:97-2127(-)